MRGIHKNKLLPLLCVQLANQKRKLSANKMKTLDILQIITIIFAFCVIYICIKRMIINKKRWLVLMPPIILMIHNLAYLFSIQFHLVSPTVGYTWSIFLRLHAIITWLIVEKYKYWNDKNIKEAENNVI